MAHTIVLTGRDASGETASMSLSVPTGATLAQYTSFAQDLAAAIDAITGVEIIDVRLQMEVAITDIVQAGKPVGVSDVEELGEFIFQTAISSIRTSLNVPTYDEAHTLAASDMIDQADADVAVVISMMEDGITPIAALVQPCDIGEADIVQVVTARERFRNSGPA